MFVYFDALAIRSSCIRLFTKSSISVRINSDMEEVDFVVVGSVNSLVEESQNNKHNEKVSATNERISCDICGKTFKSIANLERHKRKFHFNHHNKDGTTLEVFKNEIIMVVTKCVEEI